jgi:hypothetical protein
LFGTLNLRLARSAEEIYVSGASVIRANELTPCAVRKLDVLGDEEMLLLGPFADFFGR